MKIYFILAVMTVFFLSCKEEVNSPGSNGPLLESIVSENQGRDASIVFDYNTQDLLSRVEEHFDGDYFEYSYSNNTLEKILHFDSLGKMKSLDSVSYLQNGQIEKLYGYFVEENGILKKSRIYEYLYNENGLVERINTINPSKGVVLQYRTYIWQKGNISRFNEYSEDDHLLFENTFEYDHKANYKKNSPYFYFDPQHTTKNNVVKFTFTDHTGLYDGAICNPCLLTYKYNKLGYPTSFNEHTIHYR